MVFHRAAQNGSSWFHGTKINSTWFHCLPDRALTIFVNVPRMTLRLFFSPEFGKWNAYTERTAASEFSTWNDIFSIFIVVGDAQKRFLPHSKHGKQAQWHAQLTIYDTSDKCAENGKKIIEWNDIDKEDLIIVCVFSMALSTMSTRCQAFLCVFGEHFMTEVSIEAIRFQMNCNRNVFRHRKVLLTASAAHKTGWQSPIATIAANKWSDCCTTP